MKSEKPSLMLAITDGLKKKGKMGGPSDDELDMDESDDLSYKERMDQISKELISAVHDKDVSAVSDLLEEAFLCFDSQPHEEGEHIEEPKSRY